MKLEAEDALNFLEDFINLQHALDKKRALACRPCLTDNESTRLAEWDRRVVLLMKAYEYSQNSMRDKYCEEKQ